MLSWEKEGLSWSRAELGALVKKGEKRAELGIVGRGLSWERAELEKG
jgi:hypothetical protein